MLGLILGALLITVLRRSASTSPQKTRNVGVLAAHVGEFKSADANCWWCGDYECIDALEGSRFSVGDRQRICGAASNPRWAGSCPSTTTLGDNSTWQFKENCDCDG